jgi:outer membrane protein assembly factor BamB
VRLGRGNFAIGPGGVAQVMVGGANAGAANAGAAGAVAAGGGNPADANNPPGETISSVQPLSDRVVIATNGGRVFAADLTDGKLLWQSRPAKAPVERLLATDDFVVAKLAGTSSSLIAAMDAFNGSVVFRKVFARDAQALPNPVNLALSSDGTLVWIMPDRAVAKDLFETGDSLRFGGASSRPQEQSFAYALSSGEDQLVIADGRILVVAENGMFVEALSMDSGQVLKNDEDGAPQRFATGIPTNTDARPSIRVIGNMLYVATPLRVIAYDLEHLGRSWTTDIGREASAPIRAVLPSRGYLLIVTETEPIRSRRPQNKPAELVVDCYSRAQLPDGSESGRRDFHHTLNEPGGVVSWQAVEGGLYYLAGDQKLHFLAGAGTGAR